jgi:hypothetical protein
MKRSVAILSILALLLVVAAPVAAGKPTVTVYPCNPEWAFLFAESGDCDIIGTWDGTMTETIHWRPGYEGVWPPAFVKYETHVVMSVFTDPNGKSLSSKMNVRGEYDFNPDGSLAKQVVMTGSGLNVMVPGYGKVHIAGQWSINSDGEWKVAGHPLLGFGTTDKLAPEDAVALCAYLSS